MHMPRVLAGANGLQASIITLYKVRLGQHQISRRTHHRPLKLAQYCRSVCEYEPDKCQTCARDV